MSRRTGRIGLGARFLGVAALMLVGIDARSWADDKAGSSEKNVARRPGSPAPLQAPVNAGTATRSQEAWAKSLKTNVVVENSIGMKLTLIPAGEKPRSPLRADLFQTNDAFYLAVYEVTQSQYERVMGTNPSWFSHAESSPLSDAGRGKTEVKGVDTKNHPVEMVSFLDAKAFCDKLSALPAEKASGREYRLPTKDEWEIAYNDKYHGVSDTDKSRARTRAVGRGQPNAFGLYDMDGNVCELCANDGIPLSETKRLEYFFMDVKNKKADSAANADRPGIRIGGNTVERTYIPPDASTRQDRVEATAFTRNLTIADKSKWRSKLIGFRIAFTVPASAQ